MSGCGEKPWACYLLKSCDGDRTYVGATVDVDRRLRQHNGEISGGARATSGRSWERVCYVLGFENQRAALQFEWRWKYYSRKTNGPPLERRMDALRRLLAEEKWCDIYIATCATQAT
jgi:predicted GIY-YIG superfamily endonuclease